MSPNLEFKRNTAVGLDLGWINHVKVNRNAAAGSGGPEYPRGPGAAPRPALARGGAIPYLSPDPRGETR